MKLFIKNKLVSLRGSSKVLDENEQPKYIVKGKLFSITRKKKVCDLDGNLLYKVRNKYWNFITHSAFVYNSEGEKIAKLTRKFSIKSKYIILGYKDELRIEGDFLGWSLEIFKNEKLLGTINRKLLALTDSFILDVADDEDPAFFVALVIAIDNILDKKSQ